jgi:hypothetical protein
MNVERREMNPQAQKGIHSLSKNLKLPAHRAGLPGKERTKHDCAP